MKKFRAVCLAFVMMLSVAVMLCGCGDTKITDKVNFSDVDEITIVRALLFGYKIKYSYRLKSISKEIGFFYLAKSD